MSQAQEVLPRTSNREDAASQVNPDNTDINMLMLRANLENRIALEPLVLQVKAVLIRVEAQMSAFLQLKDVDGQGTTPEQALRQHRKLTEFKKTHAFLRRTIREFDQYSVDIEKSHHNVIRMAKIRAETRAIQQKEAECTVFADLLRKFMIILEEQLPPEYYAALQRRINRDLDDLQTRCATQD